MSMIIRSLFAFTRGAPRIGFSGICSLLAAALAFTSSGRALHPRQSSSPGQLLVSLIQGREQHTATLLADGRVLVAGGFGNVDPLATAELYDQSTGVWSRTGSLVVGRSGHTATLLSNGKVLVAGGTNVVMELSEAELYDPVGGVWTPTASMNHA